VTLERAFADEPLDYHRARVALPGGAGERRGFAGFEGTLVRQIVDLRERRRW
jgi:hypothetical protein